MKNRRALVALAACAALSIALPAASAQAAKSPKPKDYTYCVTAPSESGGTESECFAEPVEVFRKTKTYKFGESNGTYTVTGKSYVFHEAGGPDELIGTHGKHGVISGRLYENGEATETTFTLTPLPKA